MQYYYGQNNGYFGYGYEMQQKQSEKRRIAFISMACGGAILAFLGLNLLIGLLIGRISPVYDSYLNNSDFSESIGMVIAIFALLIPFAIAYKLAKNRSYVSELPLGKPYDKSEMGKLVAVGIMVCILATIVTGVFASAVEALFGVELSSPEDTSDYGSVLGVILSAVGTAALPAVVEEFCIRGFVLQALRRYGDVFAIMMSSFVFAILHGNMIQIPFAFMAGIMIGYAVIKTGTMWTGIIIHFANNLIAVIQMTLSEMLTDLQFNVFVSALYITIFIVGGICLALFLKKNPRPVSVLSRGECSILRTSEKTSAFLLTVPMIAAIVVLGIETAFFINS